MVLRVVQKFTNRGGLHVTRPLAGRNDGVGIFGWEGGCVIGEKVGVGKLESVSWRQATARAEEEAVHAGSNHFALPCCTFVVEHADPELR